MDPLKNYRRDGGVLKRAANVALTAYGIIAVIAPYAIIVVVGFWAICIFFLGLGVWLEMLRS